MAILFTENLGIAETEILATNVSMDLILDGPTGLIYPKNKGCLVQGGPIKTAHF